MYPSIPARPRTSTLHRGAALLATAASALALAFTNAPSAGAAAGPDHPASVDRPYVKANARAPTPGDATATCGTNRRQENEPTAAINPRAPRIITSGANEYCTVEGNGNTWVGFYRSTNGGASWTDSLLPGYPTDSSPEGLASPLHRKGTTNAGDPVQAWDRSGRLFFMGNAFNRAAPQNGDVWVATYNADAAHYVRTVVVGKGTPALKGKFNDKTSIEVDRGLSSPHAGNVYVAWSVFQGNGNNEIVFARSTDHGRTFSHPSKISEGSLGNQFADIEVTRNGTVYVAWNGTTGSRARGVDAMLYARSTDGGRSFTKPAVAARFDGFDAADSAGDPEAAEEAHEQAFENADGPESDAEPSSAGDSRDCGSGPFACRSGFTFFRHDSQPRITADPADPSNTVYMVYDATDPATETASKSTYNTAPVGADGTLPRGPGRDLPHPQGRVLRRLDDPSQAGADAGRPPVVPGRQRRRRPSVRGVARQSPRPRLQRAEPAWQRHRPGCARVPPRDARAGHLRRLVRRRGCDVVGDPAVVPLSDAELRDVRRPTDALPRGLQLRLQRGQLRLRHVDGHPPGRQGRRPTLCRRGGLRRPSVSDREPGWIFRAGHVPERRGLDQDIFAATLTH